MRSKRRFMHGKRLRRSPIKSTQKDVKAAKKQGVKKVIKPVIKKGLKKIGASLGAKMLGPVGAFLTGLEAAKFVSRASKAVMPGLKNRAKRETKGGSMYTSSKF